MRAVLRRPFSLSQLCVVRVPWTMTGSPLLTLPETLPDSSFQHSTSTQKVPASTNSWVWGSKRRAVEAMRKLVTAPFSRLTRRGESTTLPTTVTWVSFTVLLRGLSAWSGGDRRGAGTPRTLGRRGPPHGAGERSVDGTGACGRLGAGCRTPVLPSSHDRPGDAVRTPPAAAGRRRESAGPRPRRCDDRGPS